jgi:hypothetical protein
MKITIVASIFSLLGTILGVVLPRYLPEQIFSSIKQEITRDGTAEEILLNNIIPEFTDSTSSYKLTNMNLRITSDNKVFVKATISTSDLIPKEDLSGDLEGSGVFLDGMAYIGVLF